MCYVLISLLGLDSINKFSPSVNSQSAVLFAKENIGELVFPKEDVLLHDVEQQKERLQWITRAMYLGKDKIKVKILFQDIMGKKPVTVTEDTNAGEIGSLLQKERLIRVPVVKGGKLVGVVARRDLLFGYLRATSKPPLWL